MKGLKTGMYYLRTRPAADAIQFTVDQAKLKEVSISLSLSLSLSHSLTLSLSFFLFCLLVFSLVVTQRVVCLSASPCQNSHF